MSFLELYQHLPSYTSPFLFTIGDFSLRWYSLGYMLGFLTTYFVIVYRLKHEKGFKEITIEKIETLLLYSVIGVIFGGRIAYVFIYGFDQFQGNLLYAFFPLRFDGDGFLGITVTGYSGMSYHGGLIGVLVAILLFAKIHKVNLLRLMNLVGPGTALGYTWGRLGNFMNGELYGRITDSPVGMYFYNHILGIEQKFLRHPSQLYEAFTEGILTFFILWYLRKNKHTKDYMLPLYIVCYSVSRFFVEFFRQPDSQFRDKNDGLGTVLGFLTMGQVLSIIMILVSLLIAWFIHSYKKNKSV